MAKFAVMALALILANISGADAGPNSGCILHKALCRVPLAAREVSTTDRWKVAVLCCCKTYSGGECCTRSQRAGQGSGEGACGLSKGFGHMRVADHRVSEGGCALRESLVAKGA
jgi:hypothetical protein